MSDEVVSDRKAATPGEGPVGERRIRVARLELEGSPEREDLIRQVEPDRPETRDGTQAGLSGDKGSG